MMREASLAHAQVRMQHKRRKETWKDSDEQVQALNSSGDGSVVFEINATADLEDKEFKAMLGAKSPA